MPRRSRARYLRSPQRDKVIEFLKMQFIEDPRGWTATRDVARGTGMSLRSAHDCLTKMIQSRLVEKRAKLQRHDWNAYRLTEDGLAYPASQHKGSTHEDSD